MVLEAWETRAHPPLLSDHEVHVWRGWQDVPEAALPTLLAVLSADEVQRARRFVTAQLTARFTAARGMMRHVLSGYVDRAPHALAFSYREHGKPYLGEWPELYFNLSHSHGFMVLAVSRRRDLGVDVEAIRPEVPHESIARRFFSPREVDMLFALPPQQQAHGFFNCWTRKEAYLKALGWGLSIPLDRFDVTLTPGVPAQLLEDRGNADLHRWTLCNLEAAPGYAGALAVDGAGWTLRGFEWTL